MLATRHLSQNLVKQKYSIRISKSPFTFATTTTTAAATTTTTNNNDDDNFCYPVFLNISIFYYN